MSLRRFGPFLLAMAALVAGCTKNVSQRTPPTVVVARFDSVTATIPTPSDLAMQSVASPAVPASAQKDLLQSFVAAGGFPSDQAPTLSVPLRELAWNGSSYDETLPTVDPATVTAETAALFKVDVDPVLRIDIEPAAVQRAGQLDLVAVEANGSRRLAPGRYVFAVRGGPSGVKTPDGLELEADSPVSLTIQNKDMTQRQNQPPGLCPADGPAACAQAQQLNALRQALWLPLSWSNVGGVWTAAPGAVGSAYPTVATVFPVAEVASIAAFQIAPATGQTYAAVDAASGAAPLPIDLLRSGEGDTIAFNPAFGAAAEGLTTLDGFSTTAMMLAPVANPGAPTHAVVDAGTVHGANVFLYKVGDAAELLPELKYEIAKGGAGNPASAKYVAEPTPIVAPQGVNGCPIAGGCSPVIGLQPAVNTGLGLYLPPLEESTTYAVVITTRVHDVAGQPLARPTIMTLLLGSHPVAAGGQSLVGGLDAGTATRLEEMRVALAAKVFPALPAGTTVDDVALAYTFKTQSITPTALSIAALPYQATTAAAVQGDPSFLTPAQAAGVYGIDASALPPAPTGPVAGVAEVKLNTLSLLLGSTNGGAFDQAHASPEVVTALVVLPNPALVTGSCPAGFTAAHCAPLVVYRHGITRSKADVLAVAARLTAQGFVVAAIDAEKHGDRSWCTSDAQCCPAGVCGAASGTAVSTCSFRPNFTGPTDGGVPIGVCEASAGVRGNYLAHRVDCADPFEADGVTPRQSCLSPKGIPYVSANYLVSLNFFRTRDSLRQDVIDQSALVKALAPLTPSTDGFAAHLAASGYAVDPTKVYWLSQSLGSIQGVVDIAVNPRISSAVFNVGGSTVVDIFANPESVFHSRLLQLITPIQAGTADYLQLLQVAKWILDPAEPANFARYVRPVPGTTPLTSPLGPSPVREVLTQSALCDDTIPNTQNAYFASQLGLAVPAPGAAGNSRVQWYMTGASGASCVDNANAATHGFLFDSVNPTLTAQAQTTAAAFLASPADAPSTVRP